MFNDDYIPAGQEAQYQLLRDENRREFIYRMRPYKNIIYYVWIVIFSLILIAVTIMLLIDYFK